MEYTHKTTQSESPKGAQSYASYPPQDATKAYEHDEALELLKTHLADRYQVIRKLGKGSQGNVYLGESHKTHQKVAIKQLHIQSVKDWKQYDLFHREAEVLKRLDISGIAKLHETIEMLDIETPMALIVQDYIAGDPLQQFIAKGHRFQIDQIGSILLQLLDILQKLHESDPQVIHRDIKPSNILLNYTEYSQTPEVHLIDFGAVSNPQVKGGGSTVVGTYGYMAPEQLMGRATAASDLYSLAIVTVYLLSGVPPEELDIQDYHVLIDLPLEHLPYAITAFLRKMLEPRVEDRMTDYEQIRKFFTALKSQKFDEIPKVNDSKSQKKYSLDEVYSYHQTGNIVLWQELKDSTPRSLPWRYKRKFFASLFNFELIRWLMGSIILIPLSISIGYSFLDHAPTVPEIIPFLILIFSGLLLTLGSIGIIKYTYHPFHFLKHARKSMATVIRIEYISLYDSLKNDKRLLTHSNKPTWRITYSFNPPDDSSPDNLIRTVETHVKPDIKEGDIIPILYLIHTGEMGENVYEGKTDYRDDITPVANYIKQDRKQEHVYSTPYPIPVSDDFKPSNK